MRRNPLAPLLASALFLVAPARADTCDACSAGSEATTLCAAHADSERATLAEQVGRVRADEIERATTALEAIAALTAAHENAPSPRVAEALARGLEHDAPEVRRVSVRLLGSGQHEASARAALLEASRVYARESSARKKAFEREQARLAKRAEKRAKDNDASETMDVDDLRAALEEMSEDAKALAGAARAQVEFGEYGLDLAGALADGDDAALDGLLKLTDALEDSGVGNERLVAALVRQARADAVARAVELLGSWQARKKEAEKELAKLEREREQAEKRAGDDPRKKLALAAGSTELHTQRARVEAIEKQGIALHEALASMARERALGTPPEWSAEPHDAWRAWVNHNRAQLPRRVDAAPNAGD